MAPMILFAPEKYSPNEIAWSVSAEADVLEQHLKDFDVVRRHEGPGGVGRSAPGRRSSTATRGSASRASRGTSTTSCATFPGSSRSRRCLQDSKTQPEIFGSLAATYAFPNVHLTPGIAGGVQLPSTFESTFTEGGVPASRTIVVRSQGDESILPYDQGRLPIFQGRVSLRWDLSRMHERDVWLQYIRDPNGTLVVVDPSEGTASLRVPQPADRLGAALSLQARF